jgi:type IV pilus assembly protein PilV
MRNRNPFSIRGRQRGVSIVEALIALVVLSVGMLGIAGLYLESVKANRSALARTKAVQFVNDMADRIRANRNALARYVLVAGTPPTGTPPDCSLATANCTPQQAAAYDLANWYASVTDASLGLPRGPAGTSVPLAAITFTAATGTVPARYVIQVSWLEPGDTNYLSSSAEVQL